MIKYTKLNPKYLNSPRREFFNSGLGIVVALTFFSGFDFSCVSTGGSNPAALFSITCLQVYVHFSCSSSNHYWRNVLGKKITSEVNDVAPKPA